MMATFLAGIGAASVHRMKLGALVAMGAMRHVPAVLDFHHASEAGRIRGVLVLEILEGVFGHGAIPYLRLRDSLTEGVLVVKG